MKHDSQEHPIASALRAMQVRPMSEGDPPNDAAEKPQRRIEGEHFTGPYEAAVELVGYQPPFRLTEGDFLRLKHKPNTILTVLTGAFLGLGVTKGLGLVIDYFQKLPISGRDTMTVVSLFSAGLITFGLSMLFNKPRKQVMKKIEHHFEHHPPDFGYWMKGP